MSEYKRADFVQVEYITVTPDCIQEFHWRNALYVDKTDSGHNVQYANGEKEVLYDTKRLRKPQSQSHE